MCGNNNNNNNNNNNDRSTVVNLLKHFFRCSKFTRDRIACSCTWVLVFTTTTRTLPDIAEQTVLLVRVSCERFTCKVPICDRLLCGG